MCLLRKKNRVFLNGPPNHCIGCVWQRHRIVLLRVTQLRQLTLVRGFGGTPHSEPTGVVVSDEDESESETGESS